MAMRILIVGAGAVGGYFGARLAEAGRDVEGGRGTVAEQADPVQRVAQLAELFVDEGTDPADLVRRCGNRFSALFRPLERKFAKFGI